MARNRAPSVRRSGTGALISLLLAACGSEIAYSPMNAPPHPMTARPPEAVEVHRIAPSRPFVEVGTLDETGYWGDGTERADELLRARAAQIGCEALVIQGYVQHGAKYRAICIVFER